MLVSRDSREKPKLFVVKSRIGDCHPPPPPSCGPPHPHTISAAAGGAATATATAGVAVAVAFWPCFLGRGFWISISDSDSDSDPDRSRPPVTHVLRKKKKRRFAVAFLSRFQRGFCRSLGQPPHHYHTHTTPLRPLSTHNAKLQ